MYFIYIHGVTYEDTGVFGCSIPSKSNVYSSTRLEVFRQLTRVSFKNHTFDTPLTFWEGIPRRVQCRLRGSVPAARVRVVVNGREQKESETSDVIVRTQCKADLSSKRNCPLHYHYDVIASVSVTLSARTDDGSDVTCEALVPGSGLPSMRVTERVQLLYAAKLECGAVRQRIKRNTRNISIECYVYANPLPSLNAVTWRFAIGQYHYEVYAGEKTFGYKVDWQTISNSKARVSLVIEEIFSLHFTTYELIVRDGNSQTSAKVTLLEDAGADPWVRSSTWHTDAFTLTILTAILKLIL